MTNARILAAASLLLAACSGTLAVSTEGEPTPLPQVAAAQDGAVAPAEDEEEDDASATAEDATTPAVDAGKDSGKDAGKDAGKDSGDASDGQAEPDPEPDAEAPDAAPDAEPPPADAGPDADEPPPPACAEHSAACIDYKSMHCEDGEWKEWVGSQGCCKDTTRFVMNGNTVKDNDTGLTWYRHGGRGDSTKTCPLLGTRVPTSAEVLGLLIGVGTCSPAVDKSVMWNVYAGQTTASDGCVDVVQGTSSGACTVVNPGILCVY